MLLSEEMRRIILDASARLEDDHMAKFCEIFEHNTGMRMQLPILWQTPDWIHPMNRDTSHIQILFATDQIRETITDYTEPLEGHWICSYYHENVIHIYDSLNRRCLDRNSSISLRKLFPFNPEIEYHSVQQQHNMIECGVFAIAFVISLTFGKDPSILVYDLAKMRQHLYSILIDENYEEFPSTIMRNSSRNFNETNESSVNKRSIRLGKRHLVKEGIPSELINDTTVLPRRRKANNTSGCDSDSCAEQSQSTKNDAIIDTSNDFSVTYMNQFREFFFDNTGIQMQSFYNHEHVTPITKNEKYIQLIAVDAPKTNDKNKQYKNWICLHYEDKILNIFDPTNRLKINTYTNIYINKLCPWPPRIVYHSVQNQEPALIDHGVMLSLAFAISLSFKKLPSRMSYDNAQLKNHIKKMLKTKTYEHCPVNGNNIERPIIHEGIQDRRRRLKNLHKIRKKSIMTKTESILEKHKDKVRHRIARNLIKITTKTNLNREKIVTKKLISEPVIKSTNTKKNNIVRIISNEKVNMSYKIISSRAKGMQTSSVIKHKKIQMNI